jgi:hypothetical protein
MSRPARCAPPKYARSGEMNQDPEGFDQPPSSFDLLRFSHFGLFPGCFGVVYVTFLQPLDDVIPERRRHSVIADDTHIQFERHKSLYKPMVCKAPSTARPT